MFPGSSDPRYMWNESVALPCLVLSKLFLLFPLLSLQRRKASVGRGSEAGGGLVPLLVNQL